MEMSKYLLNEEIKTNLKLQKISGQKDMKIIHKRGNKII
jgi:hypothetical protein